MKETLLKIISILAMVEYLIGACLVEGGCFGLGALAMIMPCAWFALILAMSAITERRN